MGLMKKITDTYGKFDDSKKKDHKIKLNLTL